MLHYASLTSTPPILQESSYILFFSKRFELFEYLSFNGILQPSGKALPYKDVQNCFLGIFDFAKRRNIDATRDLQQNVNRREFNF